MPVIPIPRPVSLAVFAVQEGAPTYTDIYNNTAGKLDLEFGTVDATLPAMLDISAALDAEQVADEGGVDWGSLSSGLDGFSTESLDGNVAAYVATADVGQAHIDAITGAAPPTLRELPMDPTFDGGIGAPPAQQTVNIGPIKVGSAVAPIPLGVTTLMVQTQTYSGLNSVGFADGDIEFFSVVEDDWESGTDNIERYTYTLAVHPTKVGTFFVEVNIINRAAPKNTILTVNLIVTD